MPGGSVVIRAAAKPRNLLREFQTFPLVASRFLRKAAFVLRTVTFEEGKDGDRREGFALATFALAELYGVFLVIR